MKVAEAIKLAKENLFENEIEESEIRLLMAHALGVERQDLLKIDDVSKEDFEKLVVLLFQRKMGTPYAYIVGHKEFMKLDFEVNSDVLIPRDDTEILVEKVIEIAKSIPKNEIKILDLCTGSGCIAISLYKYIDNAKVYASDISSEALDVAQRNEIKNNAEITFLKSDLFSDISKDLKFDIIVSNPPYIKTDVIDTLQKEVKDNEPLVALDGGKDGLSFYKRIIKDAKMFLNKDGYLAFEIGYDQAKEVSDLFKHNRYESINVYKDYSGNDRVVIANI